MIRHAGLIALRRNGRWEGVLIEGASGSGKSDLALRALADGWRLVADDRVVLWTSGRALYGRAPDPLYGLIEAHGVGVLREPPVAFARIRLLARNAEPERLPDVSDIELHGLSLPRLSLWLREPSTPAKLRRALDHLGSPR